MIPHFQVVRVNVFFPISWASLMPMQSLPKKAQQILRRFTSRVTSSGLEVDFLKGGILKPCAIF